MFVILQIQLAHVIAVHVYLDVKWCIGSLNAPKCLFAVTNHKGFYLASVEAATLQNDF